jgi:spore germination protein GerM
VLRLDAFKVADFAKVLDNALEIAPSLPVHIRHRLSLTSAELKPTVVDVTISVASERALAIRDFSESFQKVDAKLEEMMQQVLALNLTCTRSDCLLRS